MSKKILAIVLAVLAVISCLPSTALATGESHSHCPGEGYEHTVENCQDYTTVKIVPATCGKEGYDLRQCNVCGHRFAVNVTPATGAHNYEPVAAVAPTCLTDGHTAGEKCSICGDVQGCEVISAPGHQWENTNEVDCQQGGTLHRLCSACGQSEDILLLPGEHSWTYELVQAATGDTLGLAIRYCTACSASQQITVYPDHDCVFVPVAEVAATCTESGVKAHSVCVCCGKLLLDGQEVTVEQLTISPLGHAFDHDLGCTETDAVCIQCHRRIDVSDYPKVHDYKAVSLTAATCTTAGQVTYLCACGQKKTETIPALGHTWAEGKAPSCEYADAVCETCGYAPGRLDCTYGDWIIVQAATCTQDGVRKKVCTVCEQSVITEVIPALGHREQVVTVAATCSDYGYSYTVCTREDCPAALVNGEHRLTEVVVDYAGGYDENNHNFTLTTDIPADCTHDGMKSWCCAYCNVQGEQQIIPAGHTPVTDAYVAPTCTTSGKTEGSHCAVCGEVLVAQQTIATVSHRWDSGVVIQQPTCTANGVIRYTCTVCGGTKTGSIAKTDHTLVAGEITQAATCQSTGTQVYSCADCGYSVTKLLAAVDHQWITVDQLEASHTEHLGYEDQICQWCGEEQRVWTDHWYYCHANGFEAFDSYEQAQQMHDHGLNAQEEGVLYRAGTCQEQGLLRYNCSLCDMFVYVYTDTDQYGTTGAHIYQVVATEGPLAGQIITDENYCLAATCHSEGYCYTYHCARCGAGAGEGIDGTYTKLEKTAHALTLNPDYITPTCGSPIYDNAPKYCCANADCDYVQYDGTTLIAMKTDGILCREYNYEYYLCACGQTHLRNVVGELGCYWIDVDPIWDMDYVPATCRSAGQHTQYCYFCGQTRIVTDEKLPHINADGEYFSDGCTDPVEDHFCVDCGEEIADSHNWVVNSWFDATCLEDAYRMCICADCGLTEVQWDHSVPAKGHQVPQSGYKQEVKATYEAAGYALYDCAICGMEQRVEYAQLSGLIISLPQEEEYTFGSLVSVTVSVDNVDAGLWGYTFDYVFDASMIRFVGYESLDDRFNMEVTDEAVANGNYYLTVLATAVNSESGLRQDVTLQGNTPLVRLYFRVIAQLPDTVEQATAWTGLYNANAINAAGQSVALDVCYGEMEISIRKFMDFNSDGFVTMDDLRQAIGMLTGEHPEGKLYDVTMDLDGDGEVTLEDIRLAYCVFVGDFDEVDLLLARISDEEAELLGYRKIHCSHAQCGFVSDTDFNYCPECGTQRTL